jgi:type I restriction enzyme S subunit|tara:strand:+ start:4418 stop:5602 length:1185 start_codon:yes stop_codon:yes gene_type:complete
VSWPRVKLRELITLTGGHAFKSGDFEDSGIPLIRIGTANSGVFKTNDFVFLPQEYKSKYSKYLVMPKDLLITLTGTVGKGDYGNVCVATGVYDSYLLNQRVAKINIKSSNLYKRYLYLFLATPEVKRNLTSLSRGVRQANIKNDDILDLEIPLPSLAEQKRIAAILDKADAIRRKRQQAIQLADDFLRSVFLDMFGDPVTNPKGWEVKPIGKLCEVNSGSTPSRKNEHYYKGNIPWVKTGEVDGYVIVDTEEHISKDAIKETSCKLNPKGSLLIAMYGQGKTRGKVGILGVDAATNQACAVLKPSNMINMTYLYHYIKLSYEKLRELGQGAGQPNLNSRLVKEFEILIPNEDDQEKFVIIAEKIETLKSAFDLGKTQTNINFNSLSQKAFAGEL